MKFQKSVVVVNFLFIGLCASAQNAITELPVDAINSVQIHNNIQQKTDEIFNDLVNIRRDFHEHPEVSEKEERTSKKIEDYLLSLGLEVKTNIGGYGVVGILKGDKPGKKVAWRADIDAMPSDLPDVVDFPSKNENVRHICGHDVHTTIGLGIANVLASQREDLEGTVYFIFQPSEENFKGAQAMISDGLFDLIKPDEIYGLHMTPFPVGTIATKPANVFAKFTIMEVTYTASGNQEALVDFTKEVMNTAQTYGPEAKFWNTENIFSPELGVTHPNTIYKDYVAVMSDFMVKESEDTLKIRVLVDASDEEQLNGFLASVKNKIESSKFSEALLSTRFDFAEGMPVMETPMNDTELAQETMKSISDIYGKQSVLPLHGVGPLQFSDDFAFFQKSVPGVYFYLGGSNMEEGIVAMPHTPNFAVDEECIRSGVNYFSSMLVERLKDQGQL